MKLAGKKTFLNRSHNSKKKRKKMGIIEIENMEFFAYHGCFKEEQIVGNHFTVSLRLVGNLSKAAATDNISDAINYQTAYNIVKAEVEKPSHLLENVCQRILDSLFINMQNIDKATVKVSKMNPPLGGKIQKVSVTLSK